MTNQQVHQLLEEFMSRYGSRYSFAIGALLGIDENNSKFFLKKHI